MKCPYCNDSIHPTAKFCPKCGLPIKDDATVMGGAHAADGAGPNLWIIGGGAAGIVAVALAIGMLSGQRGRNNEVVRQEPVRAAFVPSPSHSTSPLTSGSGMSFSSTPGLAASGGYSPSTGFSSTTTQPAGSSNGQVRWAWQPPASGGARAGQSGIAMGPQAQTQGGNGGGDVQAPSNLWQMEAMMQPNRAPRVVATRQMSPDVPALPERVLAAAQNAQAPNMAARPAAASDPWAAYWGRPASEPTSLVEPVPAMPTQTQGTAMGRPRLGSRPSDWVYDPVQERYALRADRVGGGF